MQSRQDQTHSPNTPSQDLEKKGPPGSVAPTRLPAWTGSWGDHPSPGLAPSLVNLHAGQIVSQPGDPYEQEAGQIADRVMRKAAPGSGGTSVPPDLPGTPSQLSSSISRAPSMIQRAEAEEGAVSAETTAENAPVPAESTPASEMSTAEAASDATSPGETPTTALIVDDSAGQLQPGQMKKSDFLAQLRDAVCTTTEEALKGTIWSAAGCPWIDHWFGYYANRDSQQIERAMRRYAPETANATSASDYIPIVCERVRSAIAVWSTTGEITGVPEGMEMPGAGLMGAAGSIASGIASGAESVVSGVASGVESAPSGIASGVENLALGVASAGTGVESGVESALSEAGSMLFKGREGGVRGVSNPQAIQGQLGSGRSLDGGVRSHMESAFGADFSHVRVHTDATAAGLSESLNARAFTIGQDVAFGSGEYRPGTLVGDALIAHELAHVVQQGGVNPSGEPLAKGGTEYNSLEEDADRSAVGAIVSLWSGAKSGLVHVAQNVMPAMRSGLGLQRCAAGRSSVRGPEAARVGPQNPQQRQPENAQQRQQMSIITDTMPAYQLPNPVPDVSQQLARNPNINIVDTSRVPPEEVDSVRYGILQAANTIFPRGSTVQLQNAYWPVTLPIRTGADVKLVRYELEFDNSRNVRADRLGDAAPRQVAPGFANLNVAGKKAQLVHDFNLTAVDDRPRFMGRPAANWTEPELDQVKAAFDIIPQRDRDALRGFTLVRDHLGPAMVDGQILAGFTHTGPDRAHDQPGPPAHNPPHIHYYDEAFRSNKLLSVGPAGATGPGGDWTLLHEVGHARIDLAIRTATAAIRNANQHLVQAGRALFRFRNLRVNPAQRQAWNAWNAAQQMANQAIVAFNGAVTQNPPAGQDQQARLLQAAQDAVQARNLARPGLAAANFAQGLLQAAANLDRANDDLLTASQQTATAQQQIPIFVSLANRFGFYRFTDYARRSPDRDSDWFAETYALYLTNPNRLSQMNRSIFLWFEAGMPMDRNWNPPAP